MSAADRSVSRRGEDRAPARRIVGAVVLVVTLLVAAAAVSQIIAVAQARSLAQGTPEEALAWRPDDARALGYRAEQEFTDAAASGRPPEAARVFARQALNANPLEVRALRVLAWVAADEGDDRRARRLMSLAASRSQRDVSSHLWMFHDRLKARDFPAAFAHGDALMRHPATFREAAVLMTSAAGADGAAARALGERLQTGPAWREIVVQELAASQRPDVTLSILLAIKDAGSPLTATESAVVATRLFREGSPQEAYLAWVLLLPPSGYEALGNVYNGDFDGPPSAGPFAWTLNRRAADIAPGSGRSGQALSARVTSSGEQSLARQTLVLAPGTYRLGLDARLDGVGDGRVEWSVSCVGVPVGPIARLPVKRSADWTPLATTFTVTGGCDVQTLELKATGDGASVWGWFDTIRIEAARAEG
ncbi:MAG: hypothetical protein Q7J28_04340 [Caulobacter sp.]|nr:hypothetical protein [Caulobacter sp.]